MGTLREMINYAIKTKCREEGFAKKGYFYYRETSRRNFQDLINFGQYSYSSGRAIGVFVGVRNLDIERLYVQFTNNKLAIPLPVLSINLGHLEPKRNFKDWFFDDSTNLEDTIDEVFKEIREYAFPFFEEYEDIQRLINAFEKRELTIGYEAQFYMLPLLYLVGGQKSKGVDFFDDGLRGSLQMNDYMKSFMENYILYAGQQ